MIQPGDLLVHYGDGTGNDPLHFGIVVYVPENGRPAMGADGTDFISKVSVVSIRKGFRQVTLGTWGNGSGTFNGFSEKPETCHVRRLLRLPTEATVPVAYAKASWDFLDDTPAGISATLTFGRGERWIPNTGQFLSIEKIEIKGKTQAGTEIALPAWAPGTAQVRITGAEDRGYDDQPSIGEHGNIYRNKGKGFAIYAFEGSVKPETMRGRPLVAIVKGAGKIYEAKARYAGAGYGDAEFVSEFFNDDMSLKDGASMTIDREGKLEVRIPGAKIGTTSFGIRPLTASDAVPGDDIALTFDVWPKDAARDTAYHGWTNSKSYMAVYDAKMLWRANLYLEEEGTLDWNILHPWDAPPDGARSANPVWWTLNWGYNEWNRSWQSVSSYVPLTLPPPVGKDFTISSLPAGDGQQVVSLPAFTPIRPINDEDRSKNVMRKTVSYSYPYSYLDGHFDSPFEFKKKLLVEQENTKSYYKSNPGIIMDSKGMTVGGEEAPGILNATYQAIPDTMATTKIWGRYLKSNFTVDSGVAGKPPVHYKAFMPGLGLLKVGKAKPGADGWNASGDWNETFDDDLIQNASLNLSGSERSGSDNEGNTEPYPAGTDCIGFAQRAMSWRFSPSKKNAYAWKDLAMGSLAIKIVFATWRVKTSAIFRSSQEQRRQEGIGKRWETA